MKKIAGLKLQIIVCGTLTACLLILAGVLVTQSYMGKRLILTEQAEKQARSLADGIGIQIQHIAKPVVNTLQMLEIDPLTMQADTESREERLPVLVRALQINPIVSAIYVGYPDGDFFLLRKLDRPSLLDAFNAPEKSAYMAQIIERDDSGAFTVARWVFYDDQLRFLMSQPKEDYRYDPRVRPWYKRALESDSRVLTEPYLFFSTQQVGITIALRNKLSGAVVGMDLAIGDISAMMASTQPSKDHLIALVDSNQQIIGYPDASQQIQKDDEGKFHLAKLQDLQLPMLDKLEEVGMPKLKRFVVDGHAWYGIKQHMQAQRVAGWALLFAVPEPVLFAAANERRNQEIIGVSVIVVILVIVGWLVARALVIPLNRLTERVYRVSEFDFSSQMHVNSVIREVNELAVVINQMSAVISRFQTISRILAREPNHDRMLKTVTHELVQITGSLNGVVYLLMPEWNELVSISSEYHEGPDVIRCRDKNNKEELIKQIQEVFAPIHDPILTVPLEDNTHRLLGILVLHLNPEDSHTESFHRFVEQVSCSAATAIETRRRVESQDRLIDAIIRLLADTIDAKSPYTSGHCERVPMIAEMFVDAAERSDDPVFDNFHMSEDERREFRIGAWLHDCGKITSPEYIIDKATKLETVYNRIHEIRTRFEVLWRDAELEYERGLRAGGDETALRQQLEARKTELTEDFAFIAKLNMGVESVPHEDIERLQKIGEQTWVRHFDNTLGLSWIEHERMPEDKPPLPQTETLLMDRPEHIIAWGLHKPPVEKDDPHNVWGFDMTLPENKANLGELYNLSQRYGTLNPEERFAINDHIVQTIRMLTTLPLPPEMKRVPEIAGCHHERLNGSGYPRKMDASELGIPARIMAIADVFEALTASDRPYKGAKMLSESMRIVASMVGEGHLDKDLFQLFIREGIYREYASQFLPPEQIDAVDEEALLKRAGCE